MQTTCKVARGQDRHGSAGYGWLPSLLSLACGQLLLGRVMTQNTFLWLRKILELKWHFCKVSPQQPFHKKYFDPKVEADGSRIQNACLSFSSLFWPPNFKEIFKLGCHLCFLSKGPWWSHSKVPQVPATWCKHTQMWNLSRRSKWDKESALQARPDCWVDFIVMCEAFFKPIAFYSEETHSAPSSSTAE